MFILHGHGSNIYIIHQIDPSLSLPVGYGQILIL